MVMNQSEIRQAFDEMNARHFNGEVKSTLEINHSRKYTSRGGDFTPKLNRIRIFTNVCKTLTRLEVRQVILHEMAHAVQRARGIRGASHGWEFIAIYRPVFTAEFGFRLGKAAAINRMPDVPAPSKEVAPLALTPSFVVKAGIYAGKVGVFVRSMQQFGKEFVSLRIEGALFPVQFEKQMIQAINR